MAIALPDCGELKADPVGNRRCNQRATAPSAMLLEALLEVLREADVVPRVPARAIEVQQVDDSVVGHRQRLQAVRAHLGGGAVPRPPGARQGAKIRAGTRPADPRDYSIGSVRR
jgi:hypothetical protein